MSNSLSIVGIQGELFWENPEKNITYFENQINNIKQKIDLIILPEMFTSGFTMQPISVAETMNGSSILWMKKMAIEKNTAITGSLVIKENNKYFNRLMFVYPSGKLEFYNKRHSFTLAGEDKLYTSGNEKLIIDYKGWKICPLICYDLRFPVWSRNVENYDLLLYVANWPVARIKAWKTLLKARAIENMSYTIGVNRIGKDNNNYQYSGGSRIIDYLGNVISKIDDFKEGLIFSKIEKKKQSNMREKLGFLKDKDLFSIQ